MRNIKKRVKNQEQVFLIFVRDTIIEGLSDFLQKSQTPVQALWSLRCIDLRVITLHPSFVKLRMLKNASLVPLISARIRTNVVSFVIYGEFAASRTNVSLKAMTSARAILSPLVRKNLPPSRKNIFRGISFSQEGLFHVIIARKENKGNFARHFQAFFFSKEALCRKSPILTGRNCQLRPGKSVNLIELRNRN